MFRLPAIQCLIITVAAAGVARADDGTDTAVPPKHARFFELRIRPLLIERCLDCHSGDEPESGLDLSSRDGLLRGGTLGPALQPGKPSESLLISAIRHDEFVKMPPKEKLSTPQIVDLTRWVELGAPWPNAQSPRPAPRAPTESEPDSNLKDPFTPEQRRHWSFQPVTDAPPPDVASDWPVSPVDQFILKQLDSAGLKPAPPANKRTLIRRATYDLTGLPPTPEEIRDFLQDDSPKAFANVVDRLLASPRYGEHWGRHWLDVARYADSNGLDENLSYANAWRYRDYVISAFNDDKPYARFVQEQIAGDLLPNTGNIRQDHDRHIATGFLALGPKMLAEDDPVKMQMDIVDEQLSTLCQTFLGLTIGCARCHDHKFDPLPAEDYYSLAGIFTSSKTMEHHNVVAEWYERPLVAPADVERIEETNRQIAALEKNVRDTKDEDAKTTAQTKLEELRASIPEHGVAMGVTEGSPDDLRIHLRGSHIALGDVAPRRFPRILGGLDSPDINPTGSGRLELAQWMTHPKHSLTGRVIVNRIWHWRFGRGLTPAVDNFGLLGQPPTHPELLDWLTCRFRESGGSLKQLHRLMMLTSTYRMSTRFDEAAAAADPENVLLWRFRRRRLTAEQMRDSLIALGTGLDTTMGGSLLKVKNRAYVTGSGTNLTDEFDNHRRSVYLPVVRSSVYDVLQAFDFPDPATPTGQRQSSTVAPQALMLMNSDLVENQTLALATRILEIESDTDRVHNLYESALGREPSTDEVATAATFVRLALRTLELSEPDVQKAKHRAWQSFCRVLLSSNEFAYVE